MRPADDSCSFVMGGISTSCIAPPWHHDSLMALRSPVAELLLGCHHCAIAGIMSRNTVLPTFVILTFSAFMSSWKIPLGKLTFD